ncbi:MAG: VanW family protein [Acidimicrobiales bacterium]|nr:VanW family protein [Acidimicrobiales bacterium]
MRRPRLRLVLGIAIPLLVVATLLATWAIDTSSASGKVPRNVTLAGRDIGRFPEDDLAATVADLAEEQADVEVRIRTEDQTYTSTAGDLGLQLDEEATVRDALELDRERALVARPALWLTSFLDERPAPLTFTLDEAQLQAGLDDLGGNAESTEPSVVPTGDGFGIVSGSAGRQISPEGVGDRLVQLAEEGAPLVVDADTVDADPDVSDQEAQQLADALTAGTADGLAVTAGDQQVTVPAPTVRSWVGSEVADGAITATLDAEKALADLQQLLPGTTEAKDASFTVVDGAVQLIPSVDGTRCCAADTPQRLLAAISGGTGTVELALDVDEPDFTTEDAEALKIVEPVGTTVEWNGQPQVKSFTTYHPCCAARVTNIHKMADIVRGTLVKPGERFSINDVVGERTAAKGFVPAGAIADGVHVEEVGGGVSQFATTMFNAAFFAGLPINTYQAHSEYFTRYPRGREATMGFPNPDLAWTNDTPYGILVWTSYTDTSITVTLYSTQHAYGEQTGQSEGRSGRCTTVSTQRTIHYPDGRTATDTFNARYRDEGATSC